MTRTLSTLKESRLLLSPGKSSATIHNMDKRSSFYHGHLYKWRSIVPMVTHTHDLRYNSWQTSQIQRSCQNYQHQATITQYSAQGAGRQYVGERQRNTQHHVQSDWQIVTGLCGTDLGSSTRQHKLAVPSPKRHPGTKSPEYLSPPSWTYVYQSWRIPASWNS